MGDQNHPSTKFTWRITGFTKLTVREYYSNSFVGGGAIWKLLIFPHGNNTKNLVSPPGNNTKYLSLYLAVADSETLPLGWSREAEFSLTLVNQHNRSLSMTMHTKHKFNSKGSDWGFTKFILLSKLNQTSGGFLVNDTMVVEADVDVIKVHPPIIDTMTSVAVSTVTPLNLQHAASVNGFNTYFASLEEFIKDNTISTTKEGESSDKIIGSNCKAPSLEEVKEAKQSLKECLNDLFNPNTKEKLANALSTLSLATEGLTDGEQKAALQFWADFDNFVSDCLIFEQEKTEYKSQNIMKSKMLMAIEENYRTHLSYKQSHDDLSKEEEELTKRIHEVQSKRIKLTSDWDILTEKAEEAKSKYKVQEKKATDAEKRKRSIEEKMPLATMRWANLLKQFQ